MSKLKDHRQIGKELDLFSFHEYAPGAVFWHPNGFTIFQEIIKLIRSILHTSGYQEIKTPVMVKNSLFMRSGHWQHFGEHNMFNLAIYEDTEIKEQKVPVDTETGAVKPNYSLKPMNCPESTIIYNSKNRSYKDLPLKFSDFGILHRRELSGVIGGLFRLREFTIDDAHIYCTQEQIMTIVLELLQQIKNFYTLFGLNLRFYLSTKPDKALTVSHKPQLWNEAENDLKKALESANIKYGIKEKDGAFYGPKIDFHITDSQNRDWQLATIQLDFQMPIYLGIVYTNKKGNKENAVIIHRAFTGSIERFIGILIEQYQGDFPLWLSPVQVAVLPVSDKFDDYAHTIYTQLIEHGIRAVLNTDNKTLGAKIRDGTLQKTPFMVIIGEKEVKSQKSTPMKSELKMKSPQEFQSGGKNLMISVRTRKGEDKGMITLYEFLQSLKEHIDKKL